MDSDGWRACGIVAVDNGDAVYCELFALGIAIVVATIARRVREVARVGRRRSAAWRGRRWRVTVALYLLRRRHDCIAWSKVYSRSVSDSVRSCGECAQRVGGRVRSRSSRKLVGRVQWGAEHGRYASTGCFNSRSDDDNA